MTTATANVWSCLIDPILIYGASGYTGRLIVDRAIARGLRPILAGRDRDKLANLAARRRLESRCASLTDRSALSAAVRGVRVVLNAAGPFSTTFDPIVDACLDAGAHYLDITGEIEVIERAARKHSAALRSGIMVMPAVGFDVVPSDCLAAHVVSRCAGATRLRIGIAGLDLLSRGSARTVLDRVGRGTVVRRTGRLVALEDGAPEAFHEFDFGDGPRQCAAVSWGDVASAFFTTGVPDVAVYFEATAGVLASLGWERAWGPWFRQGPWRELLARAGALIPEGPSGPRRAQGSATLVAEASVEGGPPVRARLRTPEVYELTAVTAIAIAERVLAEDLEVGFQTPARVYGADFVLSIPAVSREDL